MKVSGTTSMIERFFVKENEDPYAGVSFSKKTAEIKTDGGDVVFRYEATMPDSWSQNAIDIAVSKYFRKSGVPKSISPDGKENDIRQVLDRLANAWKTFGLKYGYFKTDDEAKVFYDEVVYMLIHQMASPNSPQWFNTGLENSYGIKGGEQGHYWVNPKTKIAEPTKDAYTHPQTSACFIQSIEDSLLSENGIMNLWVKEARIFKYGSGTGTNFSSLRGENEPLSGGGTSSGLMSWLRIGDRAAGAIKSGGTTRRAAKMVILNIDHPDIEKFIEWKVEEEKKVAALVSAGYPSDFNGEAYLTVSGQNSNNSVRVTSEFMSAVEHDEPWNLIARTDGSVLKTLRAKDIWEKIAQAAWSCADPGVQFDTTINEWNTCASSGRINGSNPCSEFMFLDNTACNLASLNLMSFYDQESGVFDVEAFSHAVRVWTLILDISATASSFPSKEIAQNNHDFRTIGLGYANLGALLMTMGLPYDSERARAVAASITALMTGESYLMSTVMAKSLSPFSRFEKNKEDMLRVMRNHRLAAWSANSDEYEELSIKPRKLRSDLAPKNILDAARRSWDAVVEEGEKYGYRNAQATVIAPTGTISIVMDCDTTGVEPDYALVKYKKLAGGGSKIFVNSSVRVALKNLGYEEDVIKRTEDYILEHGYISTSTGVKESDLPIFDCASGKRVISPMGHVLMVAATQPFISGAISKTVNLPNESTVADVASIYREAYENGIKSISIYRDGSKMSQPLASTKSKESAVATYGSKKKLPPRRRGFVQEARVAGHKIFLRTGEYPDGKLGEIFVDMHKDGAAYRSLMNCFAIAVSKGLQHGVPLEEFVDTFVGVAFEPRGVVSGNENIKMASSVIDYIFRQLGIEYLKRYDLANIPPAVADGDTEDVVEVKEQDEHQDEIYRPDGAMCDICGNPMVRSGTCYRCLSCGNTTGCS